VPNLVVWEKEQFFAFAIVICVRACHGPIIIIFVVLQTNFICLAIATALPFTHDAFIIPIHI
jgi:hypothetical protein